MSVNQKILDAIELLANNSVQKAGYDKTIQAQILSCEDQTIGKYKCKYQDSVFYAYTGNSELTLSKGAYVYILVPGNDMSKDKTILGTTDKLGIDYISTAVGEQAYFINGTNGIKSSDTLYLDTNNENYSFTIYSYEQHDDPHLIDLDIQGLSRYLKQSSSLIIGAQIKTSIPFSRQSLGHYGISFNLQFKDEQHNTLITRSYVLNEDNMIGNPYKLSQKTRQYAIFDIDGQKFEKVQSIEIFNRDFPNALGGTTTGKLDAGDIELSALEIKGATRMQEEELNGVSISFVTLSGTIFTVGDSQNATRDITAQVKVKGKPVSSSQNIEFYWGKEDSRILPKDLNYNKYLGRGWQCLNDYNTVTSPSSEDSQREWVPMPDTYTIKKSDATAYNNKIKVAALYNGTVLTREINIQNLEKDADFITITSSFGTQFYYGIGSTELECIVKNGGSNLSYYWAWQNNGGPLETLNTDQREPSKYYVNNVNVIDKFGIFKCSVYQGTGNNAVHLGTASIVLYNSMSGARANSLRIYNGNALFKYSTTGVTPTSSSLDNPQAIQTLTFSFYDDAGNEIVNSNTYSSEGLVRFGGIVKWGVPKNNTLIIQNDTPDSEDDDDYKYYNRATLTYDIDSRYNISKTNNQIKLMVTYNGVTSIAYTNFTFTKEGNIGTNGTEFTIKIVPNATVASDLPTLPIITKIKDSNKYILNYLLADAAIGDEYIQDYASYTIINGDVENRQLLKLQVWQSDQKVYSGSVDDVIILDPNDIEWNVLSNHYWGSRGSAESIDDQSDFTITNSHTGEMSYNHSLSWIESTLLNDELLQESVRANIIQCSVKYEGKIYYGAISFITALVQSSDDRINFNPESGFYYVMYGADGLSPQYSNVNPFKFFGYVPEIPLNPLDAVALGNTKYKQSDTAQFLKANSLEKKITDSGIYFEPISKYNGECVNNSVRFKFDRGVINIPVYFFLNRFGLANINEWDGNSVQINDEDGYILAPQVGAGQKDNNNRFTGVLMGQVKDPSKNQTQEGLFGYGEGQRTFFINSKNGSAIFGGGDGQIIIDPGNPTASGFDKKTKAMFYSSNFWKSENYNTETGLPNSYSDLYYNDAGMLIDLTTPQIVFRNKMLHLKSDGSIYAGRLPQYEDDGVTIKQDADGYIQYTNDYNFSVDANGNVIVKGDITANSGYIGGQDGWTIGSDSGRGFIFSRRRNEFQPTRGEIPQTKGIYIGTDGISAGNGSEKTFSIDADGNVQINGNIALSEDSEISFTSGTYTIKDLTSDLQQIVDGVEDDGLNYHYIKGTFIDGKTIKSPIIYAGKYYATGQGFYKDSTVIDNAAYYIYNGDPSVPESGAIEVGYLSYDTKGAGADTAANRVILRTLHSVPFKILSSGNISLDAGINDNGQPTGLRTIYLGSDTKFDEMILLHPTKKQQAKIEGRTFDSSYWWGGTWGTQTPDNSKAYWNDLNPEMGTGALYFKIE